jgi:uncharacterized protein (TIGR02145 family)
LDVVTVTVGIEILTAQGNEYSTAKFGDAGWWMTQNLRSTQYADGTPLTLGTSQNNLDKIYNYPGENKDQAQRKADLEANGSLLLKAYGLVYSWAAASGRTDTDADNVGSGQPGHGTNKPNASDYRQGICPDGWHLPSDYEWSELEQEIATNPSKYSSQITPYSNLAPATFFNSTQAFRPDASLTDLTYWGRQMKSVTPVVATISIPPTNGTSNSPDKGGFDARLVGLVRDSGETTVNYCNCAHFWSSSSDNFYGDHIAIVRSLCSGETGMERAGFSKINLLSVRCKKN